MKILLVGMTKLKYMPYMNFYLNELDLSNNEVHCIYWDRDGKEDINIDNRIICHSFDSEMDDSISLLMKVSHLIKYKNYINKNLKTLHPNLIIVMHTTTGILMFRLLRTRYRFKYIFDYRDVTYERSLIYRFVVYSLFRNAKLSFTSSDGFRRYFPKGIEVYTSHNFSPQMNDREEYKEKLFLKHNPIRIAFWGLIRHYDINRTIIKKIADDTRFELHYYGRAQGRIRDLLECADQQFANIYFHGEYQPIDRDKFALQTDLIHNVYDNKNQTTPLAMGNKYYDGFMYYIPLLSMKNSYMAERSENAGIGFACDPYSETFTDELYDYYNNLNRDEFIKSCDNEIEIIMSEINKGCNILRSFIFN